MQSVHSYRSELFASPFSTGPLNSTMTSSIQSSGSPLEQLDVDRLITTIRQLTEEKDDLILQVNSLTTQLKEV